MNPRVILILLCMLVSGTSFSQKKRDPTLIGGSWMNVNYLNALRTHDSVGLTKYARARLIYIDTLNFIHFEYRFEQKSTKQQLFFNKSTNKYTRKTSKASYSLQLLNDTTIQIQYLTDTATYIKVSSYPWEGVQAYLENYFWNGIKNWQLIHVKDNANIDTQLVLITATHFLTSTRKYVTTYEFADIDQTKVNNENLYNIVLFDVTKDYMTTNEREFAIKKEADKIVLYNKVDSIEYILIPLIQ
ncbi:MAG TPA: hypothetical protein VK559_05925 [Ferruginibacter sp.]|nr:hypothetical protein [Ferruginibacter sp.]